MVARGGELKIGLESRRISNAIGESGITLAPRPRLSSPSVESRERKWMSQHVQAGVLIVNQIESTFFQETGVRFLHFLQIRES